MAAHEDLLRRFKPALRYDSQETYFADSAAEWTDNPGNALCRRDGTVIATGSALTLGFLGAARYGNDDLVEDGDYIGDPGLDYREQYARLRSSDRERYANRIYGRAVQGGDGRLWLQYWLWYFYNDYTLAFDIGLHEGDWEMVEFRMDGDRPDLAVYAQHALAEAAEWGDVRHPEGQPDTPLVFPGRGSHASYFEPGLHETEVWYDLADGLRSAPELALELLDELPWAGWPGGWGDTPKHHAWEDASPVAPCSHLQWDDPAWLLRHATDHVKGQPGPPPEVEVSRDDGRLCLRYDLTRTAGTPPFALVVTVNSRDEPLVAPRASTFEIPGRQSGEVDTRVRLDGRKHYDVHVSTTDSEGVPSASYATAIGPTAVWRFDPRAILRALGRGFAAIRAAIGRR